MTVNTTYTFERVLVLQHTNGDAQPAIAALANGGFVSVLNHAGLHVDADIFSPGGVSTAAIGPLDGLDAAVDQLANGNIVIASDVGADIAFTIRNPTTGAQLGGNPGIGGGIDPGNVAIAALTGGRFAIAHDQQAPGQASTRNVGIEVFNADGSDAWFNLVGNFTRENETRPALAGLSNGNLAFAYQSDTDGIYVGVFDADGNVVKDRGQTGRDKVGSINRNVSMTATLDGFALVYEDNEWDGGNDITLARFSNDGTRIDQTRINDPNSDYTNPSISMLSNGMIVVTATFANGDKDMAVMLVDPATGNVLASQTLSADQSGFDNVDFSTVAGVGHGRVATQWNNTTDGTVNGELLDVVLNSTGDGADDLIVADYLKDVIDGGGGNDTVSYVNSDVGVTVTVNGGAFNGYATGDVLSDVENLIGSAFDDFLFGDGLDNKIEGGAGNDTISGAGGADQLDGGGDDDTFVVGASMTGGLPYIKGGTGQDTIVLSSGGPSFAYDLTDVTLESIETVAFAVIGGATAEAQFVASQFNGGIVSQASITFSSMAGVAETVRIFMEGAASLDLSQLNISGQGASDRFIVQGGGGGETIVGSAIADSINGGGGTDRMEGRAGDDLYYVDNAGDVIVEGASQGTADRVLSGISYTLGAAAQVELFTTTNTAGTGALNLTGNGFAQTIQGNAGANVLNGGGGADTMVGFAGDDRYFVDDIGDTVTEGAGQGTADRVLTSINYTLGAAAQVELFTTTNTAGTGALNLTGNGFVQTIHGNAGVNVLNGGGGADSMTGFAGDDQYFVDNIGDTVVEGAGQGTADRVLTSVSYTLGASAQIELFTTTNAAGTGAINLTGNGFNQTIAGNVGANIIDGKGGADNMQGFAGDDWYYVDNTADVVLDGVGQGDDRVFASVSIVLTAGAEIEILSTTNGAGTAAINFTGNAFGQSIGGNAGDNVIYGGGGNDSMVGFGGDDRYFVDSTGDFVLEQVGGGNDRVSTSDSYTLNSGQEIELFTTTNSAGTGAINLTGNNLAQSIGGNAGANVLNGGLGNDTLTGFAGLDTFFFNTALGPTNIDRIADFIVADDTIRLENAIFAGLAAGALAAGAFNTGAAATEGDDRIIYNAATGALIFDADGLNGNAGIQFATLNAGLGLTSADFAVV